MYKAPADVQPLNIYIFVLDIIYNIICNATSDGQLIVFETHLASLPRSWRSSGPLRMIVRPGLDTFFVNNLCRVCDLFPELSTMSEGAPVFKFYPRF